MITRKKSSFQIIYETEVPDGHAKIGELGPYSHFLPCVSARLDFPALVVDLPEKYLEIEKRFAINILPLDTHRGPGIHDRSRQAGYQACAFGSKFPRAPSYSL